jgi:hypothetical protein
MFVVSLSENPPEIFPKNEQIPEILAPSGSTAPLLKHYNLNIKTTKAIKKKMIRDYINYTIK